MTWQTWQSAVIGIVGVVLVFCFCILPVQQTALSEFAVAPTMTVEPFWQTLLIALVLVIITTVVAVAGGYIESEEKENG